MQNVTNWIHYFFSHVSLFPDSFLPMAPWWSSSYTGLNTGGISEFFSSLPPYVFKLPGPIDSTFKMSPLLWYHCYYSSSGCFSELPFYLKPAHCWLHSNVSESLKDSQLYLNLIVAWDLSIVKKKNYLKFKFTVCLVFLLANSGNPIIFLNINSLVSYPIKEPSHWLRFYPSLLFFLQSILPSNDITHWSHTWVPLLLKTECLCPSPNLYGET